MKTSSNYVLGINRGHTGSVALLKDGVIIAAIAIERIERLKHANGNYVDHAIDYCLKKGGITLEDIDVTVTNSSYCSYPSTEKNVFVSHHLAHAYCAYGISPFEECIVLVADGSGNKYKDLVNSEKITHSDKEAEEAESIYFASKGKIKPLFKRFCEWPKLDQSEFEIKDSYEFPSLGHLYSKISAYLFRSWTDAGKVMGLAPYGKNLLFDAVSLNKDTIQITLDFSDILVNPGNYTFNFQKSADIALSVQKSFEKGILHLAKKYSDKSENLCLVGGCALNVTANSKVLESNAFNNVFVPYCPGDDGIAIGAAFFGWFEILGGEKKQNTTVYLGKKYSKEEIKSILDKRTDITYKAVDVILDSAQELAADKIIGMFQGSSEFGPRALGNRSILANPSGLKTKDRINLRIKKREDFRPFAPSVLSEEGKPYFTQLPESPYMSFIANTKESMGQKIPAVVHADGTSRIQTVSSETNKRFHRIIKEFYKLTGIPMVLNTSFNIGGEPIVESPEDALRSFLNSELDTLYLESYRVDKK